MTGLQQQKDMNPPDGGEREELKSHKVAWKLPNLSMHIIFWSLMLGGLGLDLWSKKAVFEWLSDRPRNRAVIVEGFIQMVTAENSGAAFGVAAGRRELLVISSVAALAVITGVFFFGAVRHKLVCVSLGLFAAGVCGNLYDRLFNDGRVRDFIDIAYWHGRHWPAFNLADSMLCAAVGLLIISVFFIDKPCQKHPLQQR